jgi:hypothetical protein
MEAEKEGDVAEEESGASARKSGSAAAVTHALLAGLNIWCWRHKYERSEPQLQWKLLGPRTLGFARSTSRLVEAGLNRHSASHSSEQPQKEQSYVFAAGFRSPEMGLPVNDFDPALSRQFKNCRQDHFEQIRLHRRSTRRLVSRPTAGPPGRSTGRVCVC